MSLEPVSEQGDSQGASRSLPFPNVWWGRVAYAVFVTAMPVFSFWAIQLLGPQWQTGELRSYITLMLFPEASLLFFPLLAYSIIGYLLLLFAPAQYSKSFVIRFGVYTGILLALHYSMVVLVYSFSSFAYLVVLTWIFPLVFLLIYRRAVARWTVLKVNKVLFTVIAGALLVSTALTRGGALFFVLVALLMAAPFWSFLLAVQASIWLIKNHETKFTLPRGLGLTAWFAAYIAAWRFDILKMYELYAALPPTPPTDCYIATAAARGHRQFVHSWTVSCLDGRSIPVNVQLQRLKCAELSMLAINPRLHGFLRGIYNRVGRILARFIQNPLLADAAYVLLKPWEWMAESLLKIIVPELDSISRKMYTN
jgi:hypothetical protein